MNERSHDHDKPLEFVDEVWAEDYFVRDPISCQGVFFFLLRSPSPHLWTTEKDLHLSRSMSLFEAELEAHLNSTKRD